MSRRTLSILLAIFFAMTLGPQRAAAASEKVLHSFVPHGNGVGVFDMISDAAGNLYVASGGGSHNVGMILKFMPEPHGAWTRTVLYEFKSGVPDFSAPFGLNLDAAGNLYGLTSGGGAYGFGTLFELMPSANGEWTEQVLYDFTNNSAGQFWFGLAMDATGNFYGATYDTGGATRGSVFQLTQSSGGVWTENVLHTFTGGADGGVPSGLVLDRTGNVYGLAQSGGSSENGLVFQFTPSQSGGWTETVLHNFAGGSDGSSPWYSKLMFDDAGNLYGTTLAGGSAAGCSVSGGCGTVFELRPGSNGQWAETILYTFGNIWSSTNYPSGVVFDSAGNLFGTTGEGGTHDWCNSGCGTVFELSPSRSGLWSESILHDFTGKMDGSGPNGGVMVGATGQLFGSTLQGGAGGAGGINGTMFEISPGVSPTLKILYDFPFSDGGNPYAGLTVGPLGSFYGTTNFGGSSGYGAVYELAPSGHGGWKETPIYSKFVAYLSPNFGARPSELILDNLGNLYGTTEYAGPFEYGSVFELTPIAGGRWSEKDLVRLSGVIAHPMGRPVIDKAGNLFGTAIDGGANRMGAIFQLTPQANGQWIETVIHTFSGYPSDGAGPAAALVPDAAGNLYGTTEKGGNSPNCHGYLGQPVGCGTVFELSPIAGGGWKEQVIYSFVGSTTDGATPSGNLIFDASGNLFGTTIQGGNKSPDCPSYQQPPGCGTVFELIFKNGNWTETLLYAFTHSNGDGGNPESGVSMSPTGNLYGTTLIGGAFNFGTVFKLVPGVNGSWTENTVHSFGNGTDGQSPKGSLIFDVAGNLYGATFGGGTAGYGAVFEITP